MALQQPADAAKILRRELPRLHEPEGSTLLGRAEEASGDRVAAAAAFQRVHYQFPLSLEADEAGTELIRLHGALKESFPPAMPRAVLDRAEKLARAGKQAQAKRELLAAAPHFGGLDRDLARVRAHTGDALALANLQVTHPEADAERVYLIHAVSRRNSREAAAESALNELRRKHPKSRWTMEAVISWGNHFLLRNRPADYEPFYKACFEGWPNDPQAAYCHWKVTWSAWIRREPGAQALMREHAARFPDSEKASAALYFLKRYDEVISRFPLSFYAVLARDVKGPLRPAATERVNMQPTPGMKVRLARARQLEEANLPDWAEFELKYAAANEDQPWVAALYLAEACAKRGAHDQGIRYIKSVAKGYLSVPLEAAPQRFWQAAFPLPWRSALESSSRDTGLDPFLVAALIRQESEFNPRAISRAQAYGLTQVRPGTGRMLSRQVGIGRFRTDMLFDPEVNLKLGTEFLRQLVSTHEGQWHVALAAYNAGPGRARDWIQWYEYREPAEFIETIPFTETRNYIQIVLRNADVYRRVYKK